MYRVRGLANGLAALFLYDFVKIGHFEHNFSPPKTSSSSNTIIPQIGKHLGDGKQIGLLAGWSVAFDQVPPGRTIFRSGGSAKSG